MNKKLKNVLAGLRRQEQAGNNQANPADKDKK